jgi:hypothetical protein
MSSYPRKQNWTPGVWTAIWRPIPLACQDWTNTALDWPAMIRLPVSGLRIVVSTTVQPSGTGNVSSRMRSFWPCAAFRQRTPRRNAPHAFLPPRHRMCVISGQPILCSEQASPARPACGPRNSASADRGIPNPCRVGMPVIAVARWTELAARPSCSRQRIRPGWRGRSR